MSALVGCAPPAPATAHSETTHCRYEVRLLSMDDPILEVDAACNGGDVRGFIVSERSTAHRVTMVAEDGSVRREGASFLLDATSSDVTYRFDLDEVAYDNGNIDVALKSGDAWVVAGSTFLLRPYPADDDVEVLVDVRIPDGVGFATGMRRDGDHYALTVGELRYATYGVFGNLRRDVVDLPGPLALDDALRGAAQKTRATLEVITLPGALAAEPELRLRWIRDAAQAIVDYWHGFPVDHALLVIIPTPGHGAVAHGKVVATGGASVAIHLGDEATEAELYRDWILVHELFHLGVPSFLGEGKWLDEGLATYYEPIIRARAKWRAPAATWSEFLSAMPQGVEALETTGAANAGSFKGIYWGGAILSLLADVEIRKRSGGARGLEDALRAMLAEGGDASHVWTLDRAITSIDAYSGAPVLRGLADRYAFRGSPLDLGAVMESLGVQHDPSEEHGVRLSPDAPLAAIRDRILGPR